MQYWRYEAGHWAASNRDEFLSSPEDLVTSFFVVGNDFSHSDTVKAGWSAYRGLIREAPDSPRLRFVIWSWPSDRLPGRRLNDAKAKLRERRPPLIIWPGWSINFRTKCQFRCPVIALAPASSWAAWNCWPAAALAVTVLRCARRGGRAIIDAVLIGAAIDNDDFLPGQRFGRSLSQVHQLLVFFNPADRALRFYRLLYGHRVQIEAAGLTGPGGTASSGRGSEEGVCFRCQRRRRSQPRARDDYFQSARLLRVMHPFLFDPPDANGGG